MHEWLKSPSRAPLRRESNSPLFSKASRVKLIQGLLAPLRPTTTYVHGFVSLPRFHSPLCSNEHVELISSDSVTLRISVIARGSRLRTHRNVQSSPKIPDHDDVAAFGPSCQSQLPAVLRPVKVENQSRFKIRDLFRRSAS